MMDNKTAWNIHHQNQDREALSDSIPVAVLEMHNLTDMIEEGMKILDVGVGFGGMARYLVREKNCVVDCLDIAELVRQRIARVVRRLYLADNISSLPENEYDFIISHLVAQHIDDTNFRVHLYYLLRALKFNGFLSMQMLAGSNELGGGLGVNNYKGQIPSGAVGRVCRTELYLGDIIREKVTETHCNYLYSVPNRIDIPEFESYWYIARVKKI